MKFDVEGVQEIWATLENAISVQELRDVIAATDGVKNLTVFRQRTVELDEAVEMTATLWAANPKKNRTVVLFRAEGEDEWTVLGNEAGKTVTATLPGSGDYVVAMSW